MVNRDVSFGGVSGFGRMGRKRKLPNQKEVQILDKLR